MSYAKAGKTVVPVNRPQLLNDVFQLAFNETIQKPIELTHNQQVARLYRKSLRTLNSWAVDRDIFNEEACKIRARFDSNRNINMTSSNLSHRLLKEGEDELFMYMHPDPYVNPCMPGGTKFMRNSPPPISVCFPNGTNIPADAPMYTVNPDWSIATPENGRNATGTCLIDFASKQMR